MATAPGIKGNPLYANSDDMAGPAQISAVSAWAAEHTGEEADTAAALPSTGNWVGRHVYVTADGDYVWGGSGWVALPLDGGEKSVTPATGFAAYQDGCFYRRIGTVVHLAISVQGTVVNGTYTTVTAALPAEAVPAHIISFGGVGSSGWALGFQLGTDGTVQVGNNSGANRAWAAANISYRAAT